MARYNGLIIPRSYNDYYSRNDPQAIKDIVLAATDTELNEESGAPISNSAVAAVIPTTASAANKLATASDIASINSQVESMQGEISGAQSDIADIKTLIPNTASTSNELADKNFVNSTVGTNTANYISNDGEPFTSLIALESYAGTVTNNDYAFVTGTDEIGNVFFDRYKASVIDNTVTWAKEYRLNNSSFTAEQWAAIQSGITAEKLAQLETTNAPVDVVQLDNMHPITSNAVAMKVNGGLCNTTKSTAAKIVSIDNFVLKAGVIVTVMFTNGNSADNPTLNVNGTGEKPIKVVKAGGKIVPPTHTGYWRGATTTSIEMWQPYTILELMYDGTDWVIVGNPTVESYSSNTASYEVKADGLIEQSVIYGDETYRSTFSATISFPIAFSDEYYGFSLSTNKYGDSYYVGQIGTCQKTKTSIIAGFVGSGGNNINYLCILAKGY